MYNVFIYTMFMKHIDHCYILCNPEKEPERADYLRNWFQSKNISPSRYSFSSDCYGTDPLFQTKSVWNFYNPWTNLYGRRIANNTSHNLKPAEISLLMNFACIAKKAVDAGHTTVMILESDIQFEEDCLERLEVAMSQVPPDWDFLSISASLGMKPRRRQEDVGKLWFPPSHPYFHTRCADSMIFRVSMLKNILSTFFPFAEALDWELNFQLTLHRAKSYWLDPPVMYQGSLIGVYKSTL